MIEAITNYVSMQVLGYVAGSIGAVILAWTLKKIPNDKISTAVYGFFKKIGVAMTLGLTKWKYTKNFWNKTIEPWFIDLIDNTVMSALNGFVAGLRSDNSK